MVKKVTIVSPIDHLQPCVNVSNLLVFPIVFLDVFFFAAKIVEGTVIRPYGLWAFFSKQKKKIITERTRNYGLI